MASAWVRRVQLPSGTVRYRVVYRLGGREAPRLYGGSFRTRREADERQRWLAGELAARRVPDLRHSEETPAVTLRQLAKRWKAARVDVSAGTLQTYDVALGRLLPRLGDTAVERIHAQAVADLVGELHAASLKKQTIRKTVSVLAMVLDHGRVQPNPARDRLTVKLPREERCELRPPTAEHIRRSCVCCLSSIAFPPSSLTRPACGSASSRRSLGEMSTSLAGAGVSLAPFPRRDGRDGFRCQSSCSSRSLGLWRARTGFLSALCSRGSEAIDSAPR